MKANSFRWRILLIPLLCGFIAMGAVMVYLDYGTTRKLGEMDRSLQQSVWRDSFERDYKPAFDALFHGAPDTFHERSGKLTRLLKERFPDSTGQSFIHRPAGYAVKLYHGHACLAYITADPGDFPMFLSRTEKIVSTYPRFLLIREARD